MDRPRPTPALAMLGALTLVLAACGSGDGASAAASQAASASSAAGAASAAAADVQEVRIVDSVFIPAELTVAVGTEVVFVNEDSFAHTVTEGTDADPVADPVVDEEVAGSGGEIRVTFEEPGTIDITCRFHMAMQMTITVEG